jgi:hypothetical protein
MEIPKKLLPKNTTIVFPNDYRNGIADIEKQLERMVKEANKSGEYTAIVDIGKLIGLFLAYKELAEKKVK